MYLVTKSTVYTLYSFIQCQLTKCIGLSCLMKLYSLKLPWIVTFFKSLFTIFFSICLGCDLSQSLYQVGTLLFDQNNLPGKYVGCLF